MVALMRRLLLATGVALFVAVSAAAAAGNPLHGTFTTVIKNAPDDQLDGALKIALLPTGHYTIQRNGTVLIRGRDTETTTTISFGHETGPAACTGALGAATYRWSLRAGLLRLTTVREGCLGRHVVLTTHPLKKVG
jgi:hypothetical protein